MARRMLCTRAMSVQQINPIESEEFGKASEKLLLDIAMKSSLDELNQMMEPKPKPANLPGYYSDLQSWRPPVLFKEDESAKLGL
ncbi:MAG: hypothetical protein P8M70_07700 [Verrucomicrobiota bacterium]|nr:hypothetical protein [Verrucomicrobiota bacterium]|tara:strand:+ start:265 stop:516 length:252 start_codon:yes stop_codon:yes gene_type:complete